MRIVSVVLILDTWEICLVQEIQEVVPGLVKNTAILFGTKFVGAFLCLPWSLGLSNGAHHWFGSINCNVPQCTPPMLSDSMDTRLTFDFHNRMKQ